MLLYKQDTQKLEEFIQSTYRIETLVVMEYVRYGKYLVIREYVY